MAQSPSRHRHTGSLGAERGEVGHWDSHTKLRCRCGQSAMLLHRSQRATDVGERPRSEVEASRPLEIICKSVKKRAEACKVLNPIANAQ